MTARLQWEVKDVGFYVVYSPCVLFEVGLHSTNEGLTRKAAA